MTTFVVFLVMFIVAVLILTRATRHRRDVVQDEMERVAQETLPRIGEIAERAAQQHFGRRRADSYPAPGGASMDRRRTSWYPPTEKAAKHRA